MAIYDDIVTVINNGDYDLSDLLHRIDVIYVNGKITDDEKDRLYTMARTDANPQYSLGPVLERIGALESWRKEVDKTLAELAKGDTPGGPGTPTEEWPEYVAPTGAHDAYYNGDKVTFNGEHYTCIAPVGTACVWDPVTYPTYWRKEV